ARDPEQRVAAGLGRDHERHLLRRTGRDEHEPRQGEPRHLRAGGGEDLGGEQRRERPATQDRGLNRCPLARPQPARKTRTSPLTVFSGASSAISPRSRTSPEAEFSSSAPKCPASSVSADAVLTLTVAPCGTRASTRRPPLPKSEPSEMPNLPLFCRLTTTRP